MKPDRFSSQQSTHPMDEDSSRLSGASDLFGIGSAPDSTKDPPHGPRPDPLIGAMLNGVTIVRLVAEGGMGRVYEGWQEHPGRPVAVKVMRAGFTSGSMLKRFEHESRILGRLRHPGIAQIHTVGIHEAAGRREPYFVMEFIPHAAPITAYAESHRLSAHQRLELFRQVCLAVAHGHQRGVIHRDLKPSNILVDAAGQPKVIDFGIARSTDADMALTSLHTDVGQLVGTLQYMSPEQFDADPDEIDVRSDVYALGVVLYELLTGQPPYELRQKPVYEAARVVREATPTPLSTVNRTLRRDVSIIAGKCLEKDRTRRYASASELGADIGRYLAGEPILAAPPTFAESLRRLARRHRAAVAALVGTFVALAMAVGGISFFYLRAEQQRQQAIVDRNRAFEKESEAQAQAAEADRQRLRAEAETARANDRVYVGNLYRASDKVAEHNFDKARSLLRENHALAEGADNPIELRCLEARLDRAYAVLRGHVGGVGSVAFTPDGTRLLTRGADATLRTWNADTGELISSRGEFPTAPGGFPLLRPSFPPWFAPPAAAAGGPVMKPGDRRPVVPASGIVRRASTADGTRSVTFSLDGIVRLWDARTGEKLAAWRPPASAGGRSLAVNFLAVNRDASRVAAVCTDRRLLLWDPRSGDVAEASGHSDDIRAIAFSPDGGLLATGSVDRTARLWDASGGRELAVLEGHLKGVTSLAVNADGSRLVTGSDDATGCLWDVTTGQRLAVLQGHASGITSVAFSPDGTRCVTGSSDRTARIWNADTGACVAVLQGHSTGITGVCFSPDGSRLATAASGVWQTANDNARLWDVATAREIAVMPCDGGTVHAIDFSPDGRRLAAAYFSSAVCLWNGIRGGEKHGLLGHSDSVYRLAFSPDGRRLVTGSADHTVRVWDVARGEELAVLRGHANHVMAVAFSPDGTRLATASDDHTARIWGLSNAEIHRARVAADAAALSRANGESRPPVPAPPP